jgi:HTH-type transcriptional regulator/antitoxin MqsA
MKCPACAAAELVHDSRELTYTCKGGGRRLLPACGESVLDAAESARVSAAMLAFNREVSAGRM